MSVRDSYDRNRGPDVGKSSRSALHCQPVRFNPMKLYRILNSLLVLLLLFAQQAAYAHAITHLGKEPPANEQLAHSKLCDKCVSFEKVSGVAPASVAVLVSLELFFAQPLHADYVFNPRTVAAFHSRAPPVFL